MLLLVAVDDAAAGQVVRRQRDDDTILRQDTDVVLAHLATDVSKNLVAVVELDTEHCIRQGLDNATLDLDGAFFFSHILHFPLSRLGGNS